MGRSTTTKRITLLLWLAGFTLAGTALAQSTIVSTRIVTVPNGIQVIVDGQTYLTPITLLWPQGSSHTLHAFDQQPAGSFTQYLFGGWNSNRGPILPASTLDPTTIIVTADPGITEIDVNYATAYLVQVSYFTCTGYSDPAKPCPSNLSPGTVIANGFTFTQSGSFFATGTLQLQAIPNPGWTFAGWYSGTQTDSQAFLGSVTVTAPTNIYPHFVLGKQMTIQSSPSGLQVLADRSLVLTPAILNWGIGTSHQLGSVADQIDNKGKLWVFSSWSDGGDINHAYVAPNTATPATVTANFVPGQRVSFLTNPPGLSLSIDGRSTWLSNNFNWAVNSQHTVSAPMTQTDADGNQLTFTSWSQGGAGNPNDYSFPRSGRPQFAIHRQLHRYDVEQDFGAEPDFRIGHSSGWTGLSGALHVQQTERSRSPFNGAVFDAVDERLPARFHWLERFELTGPHADLSWRSRQADPKLRTAKSIELDGQSG